jgi:predicted lipoprotein with Yx(FWY)xxD motif
VLTERPAEFRKATVTHLEWIPMFRKHVVSLAVLITAGVGVLTACGNELPQSPQVDNKAAAAESTSDIPLNLVSGTPKSNNAPPNTGDWASVDAPKDVAQKWVAVKASKAGDVNPVVVNGADFTLYRFDKDTAKPSKSNCNDDCAKTWPPLTVAPNGKVFFAGIKKSDIGFVKRDDGQLQVTIGGWPAYRFSKDLKPGETKGQGVGGTWFGLKPNGQKAGADAGTPTTPPAGGTKATSAILFDDANFSDNGPSQGVAGKGCQNLSRPDVTSSISAGGSLKLWTEKDCKGKSTVIDGDVTDLKSIDFDNTLASVFFG